MRQLTTLAAGVAALALAAGPAFAVPLVRVGKIESEKSCTLYKMTAGTHREAGVATPYGAAFAARTSWIDYFVKDCSDNFASLKTSIQAALASSGKFAIASGGAGGAYVVAGRISDVSGGGLADPAYRPPGGSFAISSSDMFVNMDVTVRDAGGRIIYGGLLTKHLETGFSMETRGLHSESSQSGQAVYGELQHQVALAVARMVAFKIEPLRVTASGGQSIQLNYGAPLLQLGTMVQVTASDGSIVKYNVTGAGQGSALATYYGGGSATSVTPGNTAIVIEPEDPASQGRRFEKVDLP